MATKGRRNHIWVFNFFINKNNKIIMVRYDGINLAYIYLLHVTVMTLKSNIFIKLLACSFKRRHNMMVICSIKQTEIKNKHLPFDHIQAKMAAEFC